MLIGVGHGNNTSLHLAEHRADWPGKRSMKNGCAMMVEGRRRWVEYEALDVDSGDFDALGRDYEVEHPVRPAK